MWGALVLVNQVKGPNQVIINQGNKLNQAMKQLPDRIISINSFDGNNLWADGTDLRITVTDFNIFGINWGKLPLPLPTLMFFQIS